MKPTNPNPNEFKRLNEQRKFSTNLTREGALHTENLVTVANQIIKIATAEELIDAVSGSPARMIDLVLKVNRVLEAKEEKKIDLNVCIVRDGRLVFHLATLLDRFMDGGEDYIGSSFRYVYNRAGEILQQDIFYLAEEYEKANYNIFETDDELPF